MIVEIKIPSPGESITEVEISTWFVSTGDYVEKDQELGEIESDKATLPLMAEVSGKVKILVEMGKPVAVGSVACTIDPDAEQPPGQADKKVSKDKPASEKEIEKPKKDEPKPAQKADIKADSSELKDVKISPVAREMMKEHGISVEDIISGLKRIGKREVELSISEEHTSELQSHC